MNYSNLIAQSTTHKHKTKTAYLILGFIIFALIGILGSSYLETQGLEIKAMAGGKVSIAENRATGNTHPLGDWCDAGFCK